MDSRITNSVHAGVITGISYTRSIGLLHFHLPNEEVANVPVGLDAGGPPLLLVTAVVTRDPPTVIQGLL